MPAKSLENQNRNILFSQRSIWLFIGKVMPVLILFYITVLYSRKLDYTEYGRFQSVWMYINILNIIVSFGAPSLILSTDLSFLRSFFRKNKKYFIGFYTGLAIITFSIFIISTKLFSPSTKFLLIGFTAVQTISVTRETTLLKAGRMKAVFAINFLYSLLFLAWHYYVLYNGFDLDKLIKGVIAVAVIKLLLVYIVNHGEEIKQMEIIDNASFQKHWLFFGANDVLSVASRWIDKLFLVYLLIPADFALYFNGSFEIPLFALLVSTIGMIALIEISPSLTDKNKVVHVFRECFLLLSNIVFPLFFYLLFFNKELFSLIFTNKYNASLPIFIISICILPVRINNYTVILQCFEKGDKVIAGSVLDICLAFLLMLITYHFLGTRGIALAVVIATYAQAFYYMYESAKVLKTSISRLFPKVLYLRFLAAGVFYLLLYFATQNMSTLNRLIISSGATFIIVLIYLVFFIQKRTMSVAAED